MCDAPEFHQAPRPLVADCHARALAIPRSLSLFALVLCFFHCLHKMLRSFRLIHPSSSSNVPFTSLIRKYSIQPRSKGFSSSSVTQPRLRPLPRRKISLSLSLKRLMDSTATFTRGILSIVIEYPRNFLFHGRSTALFCRFTFSRSFSSKNFSMDFIVRSPALRDPT